MTGRILDRLVASSFLKTFLAFVLGAPVLFILGDFTEQQDSFLEAGLTGSEILLSYVYLLPNYVLWSFPIAALVAAVFTVNSMTANYEVVAAKAGGISFHRLIAPLLVCGALLTVVALGLTAVVPGLNRKAGEIRRADEAPTGWRTNFVYLGEDGRSVAVRRLDVSRGRLEDVVMQSGLVDDGRVFHTVAEEAVYDPGLDSWRFRDGEIRQLLPGGAESAFRFEEMLSAGFRESPEDLMEEVREEEEMGYFELGRMADVIRRSGGTPHKLLTKKEQRIAIPAATLVIILFGAPLATSSKRGGAAFGVGVSLASTILYIALMKVSGTGLGYTGILPAFWAAWLPNFVFLAVGLLLLARVRT